MKIRTVALGIILTPDDFVGADSSGVPKKLSEKLSQTGEHLRAIEHALSTATNHEVQTLRVHTNSFETWLLPLLLTPYDMVLSEVIDVLARALETAQIGMCSIGTCETAAGIALAPTILAMCEKLSCSALFRKESADDICPSYEKCVQTARSCVELHKLCGDLGNFRFCASFHCPEGIPFFPAAYRKQTNSSVDAKPLLTIGLENGDLLFLAFHGTQSTYNTGLAAGAVRDTRNPHTQGRDHLRDIMQQICLPIQAAALQVCAERGIIYGGIDASINPGLALPDSIGAGLESLMPVLEKGKEEFRCFGAMGTLAAVSTVTTAVKSLVNGDCSADSVYATSYAPALDGCLDHSTYASVNNSIKLAGYSGLMLPVMEDVILAQRATEGRFTFRDLLTFSAVCGVGLDTVPIAGNTPEEALAGVYMETATMAFRLNKPLSCRVLPQQNKVAGDVTDVFSPYLCNSTVFAVP